MTRKKLPDDWDDEAENAYQETRGKLLEIGGDDVQRAHVKYWMMRLHADGQQYPIDGISVVAGWPFSCLSNSVPRWIEGEGDFAKGYSLHPDYGTWWWSNWLVRPDGTVLDSVPGLVAYFGVVMKGWELEKYVGKYVRYYGERLAAGYGQAQIVDLDFLHTPIYTRAGADERWPYPAPEEGSNDGRT